MNSIQGVGARGPLMGLALFMAVAMGCAEPMAAPVAGATKQPRIAHTKSVAAGPPFLVRDLWEGDTPYYGYMNDMEFTVVGKHLFFANTTPAEGLELWTTDGTVGGTALVKDLAPGVLSSEPTSLTEMGGWLYFSAAAKVGNRGPGSHERYALWRTRGTPESTEYVHALGRKPHFIARMGDALYYIAGGGFESPWTSSLWRTDGTEAGTLPLKEVSTFETTNGRTDLRATAQAGGTLFFAGYDTAHGMELWKTDGTAAGTGPVKDIIPGGESAFPDNFVAVNDVVLFTVWARPKGPLQLWRTDGTAEGTFRIKPFQQASGDNYEVWAVTVTSGAAYFIAQNSGHGKELWRTDGTDTGTHRLDLAPGVKDFAPKQLAASAGQLFFTALDKRAECSLWRSDGTTQGTQSIISISSNYCRLGWTILMLATPDGLYFFVGETDQSRELWRIDGTTGEARRLTDGLARAYFPDGAHTWNAGTLSFIANGGELWTSDGTPEGTRMVLPNSGTAGSSHPREAVSFKGRLFVSGAVGPENRGLWVSDGTRDGTELLADRRPTTGGEPFHLMPAGQQLYFLERKGASAEFHGIWRTDGTRVGTWSVGSLHSSFAASSVAVVGEELFFVSRRSYDEHELWKTDGTPGGQVLLKRNPDIGRGWNPGQFTSAGGRLFFVADTSFNSQALWVSDGTPEGTRMLANFRARENKDGFIKHVVAVGDAVFFVAAGDGESPTLWKSDGTEQGTVRVAASGTYAEVSSTVVVDGTLYFIASDSGAHALWKSDGTTTTRVKEIPGGARPVDFLSAFKGAVYFWAYEVEHGYELWKSDGTEAGTGLLTEIHPGPVGAVATPGPLVALGPDGPLMFAASDGVSGMELWQTDGTAEGTVLAADLVPGAGSSSPQGLTVAGRHLFFSAWRKDVGVELWALPRTVADTTPPKPVCPARQFAEATSSRGAEVLIPRATVTDDTDPSPLLLYSHGNGTLFPLGDSSVTVTAMDESGNRAWCQIDITVRDTQPPTLTCPPPQREEATDLKGALVEYPWPVASDIVSVPVVRTSHSTPWFPVGTTDVEVTATDGAGLSTTCHFSVRVVDTVAPQLKCPEDIQAEASMPEGAVIHFSRPDIREVASIPVVVFSEASGSTFPVGQTPVLVTATDSSDNSARCLFYVDVLDTTPPRFTCPPGQRVTQTSPAGAVVNFPTVDVVDTVSAARVEFVPRSNSLLPPGTTDVMVSATDASGNVGRCSFQVEVVPAPPRPDAGPEQPAPLPPEVPSDGGCTQTGGAPLAFLGLVVLRVLASRARHPLSG